MSGDVVLALESGWNVGIEHGMIPKIARVAQCDGDSEIMLIVNCLLRLVGWDPT